MQYFVLSTCIRNNLNSFKLIAQFEAWGLKTNNFLAVDMGAIRGDWKG